MHINTVEDSVHFKHKVVASTQQWLSTVPVFERNAFPAKLHNFIKSSGPNSAMTDVLIIPSEQELWQLTYKLNLTVWLSGGA